MIYFDFSFTILYTIFLHGQFFTLPNRRRISILTDPVYIISVVQDKQLMALEKRQKLFKVSMSGVYIFNIIDIFAPPFFQKS